MFTACAENAFLRAVEKHSLSSSPSSPEHRKIRLAIAVQRAGPVSSPQALCTLPPAPGWIFAAAAPVFRPVSSPDQPQQSIMETHILFK